MRRRPLDPGAMEIVSFAEADVPADLRLSMLRLQRQAWPDERPLELRLVHDPALQPVSMLLIENRTVVAALDILSKQISHHGQRYAASGLSTVVTDEALRGRGYGRRLVEAARGKIEASGADLGIFTCDRPLQSFYVSAGWQFLPGTVLVGGTPASPFPSDQFEKVTMARFFSTRAKRFASTFVGSRVELYPGEIDRLW